MFFFFFSSRRRHTRSDRDWSSDVCSSDLQHATARWLARYHADVEGVTLADIREIADLLAALPVHGCDAGVELAARLEARGLHRCATRVRDLAVEPAA